MSSQGLLERAPAARQAPGRTPGRQRFFHLTYTLAVTEWKLRFFDSFLGYLWTLARPLLMFGVLYVVFSKIAKLSTIPHYPVYLLMGIILYTFFQEGTSLALRSVVDRENLMRKIRFPRMVIPLSVVLTSVFNLATNLVVLFAFMLITGVSPEWSWLEFPALLGLLVALTTGLALILSVLFVRFRDMQPIWDVFVQLGFYGSPILYPISQFKELGKYVVLAPIAAIITQTRHALIENSAPSVSEVAGGKVYVLIPIAITLGILALGLWMFRRAEPRLAEDL